MLSVDLQLVCMIQVIDCVVNFIDRLKLRRNIMWTTPAATEMRFGFEVTMYVMNK